MRPCWLRRAVRKRHRHAIEQVSRRWRGGRRGDSARTRRNLISTQAAGKASLVLFLEDPTALKRSHEADFDRLSSVWHLLGKEVATVPEEYEPLQAPNEDPFT